jgi:hypothetical protein
LKYWFYNHYGNPKVQDTAASVIPSESRDLPLPSTGTLFATTTSRRKTMDKRGKNIRKSHRTELQVYISLYYQDTLKAEVDIAFNNAHATDSQTRRIDILTRIAQEHYAAETTEVKEKVREHVQELREHDALRNQLSLHSDTSQGREELRT